ncbi:unnamed protein product [Boreogadus saida]
MDDERLVVEVEKYVQLYDQSSRHYKDNSKKGRAFDARKMRAVPLRRRWVKAFPPEAYTLRDGCAAVTAADRFHYNQ